MIAGLPETASSPVFLDASAPLRRTPFLPEVPRPAAFNAAFEDLAVFYDVFRSQGGRHVYLIGPMGMTLEPHLRLIMIEGVSSGRRLRPQIFFGRQAVIVRVALPQKDRQLWLEIAGQRHVVDIEPNRSGLFAGRRVICTINKNNALDWIVDWARFYVRMHGADAVLLYDNGSTLYNHDEIAAALSKVEGIKQIAIVPWRYKFGANDPVQTPQLKGGHWTRFAQPPMFTQAFRKYCMRSKSMLNVDIDELVVSPHGWSVFGAVERAPFGTLRFNRIWVENIRGHWDDPPRHRDFCIRLRGKPARDRGKKWAVNPRRAWLASWRAQLWTHQVRGWLNLAGSSADFYGYHFRGLSLSWHDDRSERPQFDPKRHCEDALLKQALAKAFER